MNADSGSRALNAASDLVELLRLAHGATERLEQSVYGVPYEHAELIARDLQRLRRLADRLHADIEKFVSRETGRHPQRRASDRAASRSSG